MNSVVQSSAAPSAAARSFEAQFRTRKTDAMWPVREQAMERFLKLGLPSLRDETWRYTDLRAIASQTFVDAPQRSKSEIHPNASLSLFDGKQRAATVLVVNGRPVLYSEEMLINDFEISTIKEKANLDP